MKSVNIGLHNANLIWPSEYITDTSETKKSVNYYQCIKENIIHLTRSKLKCQSAVYDYKMWKNCFGDGANESIKQVN